MAAAVLHRFIPYDPIRGWRVLVTAVTLATDVILVAAVIIVYRTAEIGDAA
jgi:hypothetical protein